MCTMPSKWQTEIIVFFGDDTSWISQLFPIISRSEFHVVEKISIRIFQWQRNPVVFLCVMWNEPFFRLHELHLQQLGSWYHCLSK